MPCSAATRAAPSGPRTQWKGTGLPPVRGRKRSSDVEGVQLGQAHAGSAPPGEADVGHLCGGQHPMVVEEAAEHPVPVGQPVEHGEEPTVGVAARLRLRWVTTCLTALSCPVGRLTAPMSERWRLPALVVRRPPMRHGSALGRTSPADSRPLTP